MPLVIGIGAGAVAVVAAVAIILVLMQPGRTTTAASSSSQPLSERTPSATTAPTTGTTTRPPANAIRADSQFADNKDPDGWTCDKDCRVENGKLRLTPVVPEGESDVDWWLTPRRGWTEEPVTTSTVTLTGVTFDSGEPFIGVKCAARIEGDKMLDGYQVELRSDGYVGHFEFVDGKWSDARNQQWFNGNTKNPGTVQVTCEKRGADYSVTMKVGDSLTSETTYRGVNRTGTTLLSYGGYGGAGARSEVSLSGILYEAVP